MANRSRFDPSDVFVYRGRGRIPRNAVRVEVHRSVKFIPDRLFGGCGALESVLLHEGLLKIGNYAFLSCSSLISFRCPSTVREIGVGAFSSCSNLATVELPEGLELIEERTFQSCTSLEEARIPASVAQIGYRAFRFCDNLASVRLGGGLRVISDGAFDFCQSLGSLRLPSSVDEIGNEAFDHCVSLSLVRLHEDLPRMGQFAFRGCALETFRPIRLLKRMKAIRMDDQMYSVFESRLSETTLALTGADRDDDGRHGSDDEVWEKCKESLGRAHKVLTYLELKGAAPVLELALWKAKIEGEKGEGVQGELVNNEDGGQDPSCAGRERKRPKVIKVVGQDARLSREDCRVKCGADIVFPEVLKFFAYSPSWPRLDDSEGGNVDY